MDTSSCALCSIGLLDGCGRKGAGGGLRGRA